MIDLRKIGLKIIDGFITEEEENDTVFKFHYLPEPKSSVGRNVWRYGKPGYYKSFLVSENIPEYLEKMCSKVYLSSAVPDLPNSVTVNFYDKGSFIPLHIDHEDSGEVITILSLLSDTEVMFKNGKDEIPVTVKRRSLMQFSDDVRSLWKHGILKIEEPRYSLVFRHNK